MLIDRESPFTGEVIGGRYVLGEQLGTGGMGIVFAAHQPALGRTVALKILKPELRADAIAMRRFHDEAIAGSRLSHPNIVSIFDFGKTAHGVPFLAMQRLEGAPLGQLLAASRAFSLRRASLVVDQILAALGETHRLGMVHADIKSDNVLVEPDRDGAGEHATVIDFGLVRIADRPLPDDNEVSGTPDYIAPELVLGEPPTIRSDLYAVGCILYELITGTTPFGGGLSSEIMARHVDAPIVPPSVRAPDLSIPKGFDQIIARVLAKEPRDRFASASDFAIALAATTPASDNARELPALPETPAFSSKATTRDRPAPTGSRQTMPGRHTIEHVQLVAMRATVGEAILSGDTDKIIVAYLELAGRLVKAHRMAAALEELSEAVDVVTCGEGSHAMEPAPLWRLLLSIAAIQGGLGNCTCARTSALGALAQATHAKSRVGRTRAKRLLGCLDRPQQRTSS